MNLLSPSAIDEQATPVPLRVSVALNVFFLDALRAKYA
jgi:hypothetical protein